MSMLLPVLSENSCTTFLRGICLKTMKFDLTNCIYIYIYITDATCCMKMFILCFIYVAGFEHIDHNVLYDCLYYLMSVRNFLWQISLAFLYMIMKSIQECYPSLVSFRVSPFHLFPQLPFLLLSFTFLFEKLPICSLLLFASKVYVPSFLLFSAFTSPER